MAALHLVRLCIQKALGHAINDGHSAFGIEADDTGTDTGQHRFGETAAFVDLTACGDKGFALGAQLARHTIEGAA